MIDSIRGNPNWAKDWRVWGGAVALIGGSIAAWRGARSGTGKTTGMLAALVGAALLVWRAVSGDESARAPSARQRPVRSDVHTVDDFVERVAKKGPINIGADGLVCEGRLDGIDADKIQVVDAAGGVHALADAKGLIREIELVRRGAEERALKVIWGPDAREEQAYRLRVGGNDVEVVRPRLGTLGAHWELEAVKYFVATELAPMAAELEQQEAPGREQDLSANVDFAAKLGRLLNHAYYVLESGSFRVESHPTARVLGEMADGIRATETDRNTLLAKLKRVAEESSNHPPLTLSRAEVETEAARCRDLLARLKGDGSRARAREAAREARLDEDSTLARICKLPERAMKADVDSDSVRQLVQHRLDFITSGVLEKLPVAAVNPGERAGGDHPVSVS
ncbi:MAG: hypothetical protein ACKVPX_13540 [Myxococcaceae bacterium]